MRLFLAVQLRSIPARVWFLFNDLFNRETILIRAAVGSVLITIGHTNSP